MTPSPKAREAWAAAWSAHIDSPVDKCQNAAAQAIQDAVDELVEAARLQRVDNLFAKMMYHGSLGAHITAQDVYEAYAEIHGLRAALEPWRNPKPPVESEVL